MIEFPDVVAPRASIIVVALREAPLLMACLESIRERVSDVIYEVIVVLNDPTPELATEVDEAVAGATVIRFRANLGFAGAVNFAADRARGEYLVLLNDDCIVAPDWLESLVDTEQRRPGCAIVGSTFLNTDGTLQEAGAVVWSDGTTCNVGDGAEVGFMHFERRVDYASGGSLLIRRDVWDQLGGFADDYYPAYFEDVDFCLRAAEAGWEVWYQPRSTVHHARWTSTAFEFRWFLHGRAHETFTARWSGTLETREPNGALEQAVWKAMGCPIRVLVVDDRIPDPDTVGFASRALAPLVALERETDIHVSFFASAEGRPDPRRFPVPGVRVIMDLEAHLAAAGVDYDVVVVRHPHDGDEMCKLVDRYLPRARLVYESASAPYGQLSPRARAEADPARRAALIREAEVLKRLETSLMSSADCVICPSESAAEAVRQITDTPVRVLASGHDAPSMIRAACESMNPAEVLR